MTDLHHDAVVVDCHNDLILDVSRKHSLGRPDRFASYWLPELRQGGVDVQVVPVSASRQAGPEGALRSVLNLTGLLRRTAREHADDVALCTNGPEIDAALAQGKIALIMSIEGCDWVGEDVELFETFHALGLRMACLTHFKRTLLGDGSGEDGTGGRLTRAGVAAIREMDRLGIVVDISHLSVAGVEHVLETATRQVIASHSSARSLCDHHRNLSDHVIRAIAATGGVVGVNLFPGFVRETGATIDDVVDHVLHIASVGGVDCVGLGPDFIREYFDDVYAGYEGLVWEGVKTDEVIDGLAYARDLPNLTAAMVRRGIAESDIRKVLGENFVRVFRRAMGVPGTDGTPADAGLGPRVAVPAHR